MPHGGPDWGTVGPLGTIFTVEDMAELAVRLGSPVSFDRRGNVMWYDDFEHSLNKWEITLAGAGGSAAITNERARTGAVSCKIITGNSDGDEAICHHYEMYPVLSRIGFEISLLTAARKACFALTILLADGTFIHTAAIRYDFETQDWYYYDSTGLWVSLSSIAKLTEHSYIFNTLKLVIDPNTQKYVRLIANNVSQDISSLSYYRYHYPLSSRLIVYVTFYPKEDASKTIYLDDVILTQNEP